MFSKLIPPWAWVSLVIANCLMGFANIISGNHELMTINFLSAGCCLLGYISITKINKGD